MQFQTKISVPISPQKIQHQDNLLLLGSCFSENIGRFFQQYQFPTCINPFGIVFNPLSMAKQLDFLMAEKKWTEADLILHKELWLSLEHHSHFSHIDREKALNTIQEKQEKGAEMLQKARFLFLTFGSAWAYFEKESGEVVANCHKIPAQNFEKKLLSLDDLQNKYHQILTKLWAIHPTLQVILTVSPVRHLKDGATENQWSKSILLLLSHYLQQNFPQNVSYFPAYEIVMDELRDYRFFEADMLHPNKVAIDYIWQRFSESYFNAETYQLIQTLEKIRIAEAHRPNFTETIAYQQFLQDLAQQKKVISQKYPFIFF